MLSELMTVFSYSIYFHDGCNENSADTLTMEQYQTVQMI